jgi:DNA (cytosine-5)-methyltransferase 1
MAKKKKNMETTFFDLFSGCGGFSLGFKWAGFNEVAALDNDTNAIKVFKQNFPELQHVYQRDLTTFSPKDLVEFINMDCVDVIIGGPPCQGFSTVRQRDGSNSGTRMILDNRRELYKEFLKFVEYFKPKIFVMENVPGIKSADGGRFFNRVQHEARQLGYRVHSEVIKAWEYGVPQKRVRQLIIGTQMDLSIFSSEEYMVPTHSIINNERQKIVTLWEAIGDLPPINAGQGADEQCYDLELRKLQLDKYSGRYIIDILGIDKTNVLTAHKARKHSARDLRDFMVLHEGESSAQAISRGECMEFPYNRDNFKDRYTRQHKDKLSSTIVAHLSKDGLMFIHPTQNRSFSPREAARIQSFPDYFQFPVSGTHQFRLIGNAVPPLVGLALGKGICKWLKSQSNIDNGKSQNINQVEALKSLIELINFTGKTKLSKIPHEIFIKGWFGISCLYPYLHPKSALENGDFISEIPLQENPILDNVDKSLTKPIYERSGWPVYLVPLAVEARRRFELDELSIMEYYWHKI